MFSRYPDARVIAPPRARDSVSEAAPVDATEDIIGDPAIAFRLVTFYLPPIWGWGALQWLRHRDLV